MKIVHVITSLDVGGAQMMLFKLLQAMDRGAFEPLVVSLIPDGCMEPPIAALGVPVVTLGMRRGIPAPQALVRLVECLRRFQPDLVQTWMYHADLIGSLTVPLVRRGRGRARPSLVWNIRQSDLDPRLTRRATRVVARLDALLSHVSPDHIVCCSERARAVHLGLGYRERGLSVIPNGFDLGRFRPDPEARIAVREELGIPASAPLVGMVARPDPQKDVPGFLNAAARLRARRPGCRFLLCGEGMEPGRPQLAAWVAETGLGDALSLLGPRVDLPRVYAALDLLVSASAYGEGFPNVIGEAMSCELPCVVTDVGDSALIVADTGLSVPPRDPGALSDAIDRLLAEGAGRLAQRGRAARARIESSYALPVIAARYAQLYQSLDRA